MATESNEVHPVLSLTAPESCPGAGLASAKIARLASSAAEVMAPATCCSISRTLSTKTSEASTPASEALACHCIIRHVDQIMLRGTMLSFAMPAFNVHQDAQKGRSACFSALQDTTYTLHTRRAGRPYARSGIYCADASVC